MHTPCTISHGRGKRLPNNDDQDPAEGLPSASRRRSSKMGRRPDDRPLVLVLVNKASDFPVALASNRRVRTISE